MFAPRYFAPRYFGSRYFPPGVISDVVDADISDRLGSGQLAPRSAEARIPPFLAAAQLNAPDRSGTIFPGQTNATTTSRTGGGSATIGPRSGSGGARTARGRASIRKK